MGMLFFTMAALAQTKTVTGKVTDEKTGDPLAGANVQVKGTNTVVRAGSDGSFSITAPDNAKTLIISYAGYDRQEVAIGNGTNLGISLAASGQAGEEVVVVGYGTQKKKDVTASIST
ncbi:MAG: carboxypeptidase-like regulatory domain-containing protein, partial [Dinghuibacter sp.]|nr:carboxypeptidase-like regulatory domain-containing protein [Dinghuibacter sp.]